MNTYQERPGLPCAKPRFGLPVISRGKGWVNMRLEQGKELNRYILGDPEEAWGTRKHARRKYLPLLALPLVLSSEMVLLASWLQEKSADETIRVLLSVSFFLVLLMVGVAEGQAALFRNSRRLAEISDKGFGLFPARQVWRLWENIEHVHFEPVPGLPGAAKVTFAFRPVIARRRSVDWKWSMVLTAKDQQDSLLTELQAQRSQRQLDLKIFQHPQPLPARATRRLSVRPLWAGVSGCLLLFHGLPCLILGLMLPMVGSGSASDETGMTPRREQQVQEFFIRHSLTVKDCYEALVVTGVVLTIPGALLMAYGNREISQQDRALAMDATSDSRALAEQAGMRI